MTVTLPYLGPTVTETIVVQADLARLDVHFSVDTTGSFGEEIDAMQRNLERRIIPTLEEQVHDVVFGVSRFEDFPLSPYGHGDDQPFELLTGITTDRRRVAFGVATLDTPLGHGGDGRESGAEALYQIATGEGYRVGSRVIVPPFRRPAPGGGNLGGVGFREGALHVVVHITDAPSHEPADYGRDFPGTRGVDEAAAALRSVGARLVGIASGSPARSHLERLALETGAAVPDTGTGCETGVDGATNPAVSGSCPFVFDVDHDGTGLSEAVIDAIVGLVSSVRFTEAYGHPLSDGLGFVQAIEASEASPPPGVPEPSVADRRPAGDGFDDTFLDVGPGTALTFTVRLRNHSVPPADYEQSFRLLVEIRGDELVLARRTIRVRVPRGRLTRDGGADSGGPDGGPSPADASIDAGTPDGDVPDATPDVPDARFDAAGADGS